MTGTQKVGREGIELASPLLFIPLFLRHGEGLDVQHRRMQQCAAQGGGEKSPCAVNGNNQEGGCNAAF